MTLTNDKFKRREALMDTFIKDPKKLDEFLIKSCGVYENGTLRDPKKNKGKLKHLLKRAGIPYEDYESKQDLCTLYSKDLW